MRTDDAVDFGRIIQNEGHTILRINVIQSSCDEACEIYTNLAARFRRQWAQKIFQQQNVALEGSFPRTFRKFRQVHTILPAPFYKNDHFRKKLSKFRFFL